MQITRGRVYIQRLFDIAEEVDLVHAERLVADLARRPRFAGSARHIQLPNPPLEITLGPKPLGLIDVVTCDVVARLYDVGALVVTFIVDIPTPATPEGLIELSRRISAAEEAITQAATPICNEIKAAVKSACKPGEVFDVTEEYTIFYIQATQPASDAETLGTRLDIPRLLLGEVDDIANDERAQLIRSSFSFRPDDLVCIDWNAALVLDPSFAVDVPELLELVSVQMLELRTYDALVGTNLSNLYVNLDNDKKGFFRSSHFVRLSRRIMKLYVDVVEITERIDNALTFLGDTYLARVHRAAVAEFGIPHWQQQLRNKLEVLRQINDMIVDQITSQKSLNIEILIAGLIIIEVIVGMAHIL